MFSASSHNSLKKIVVYKSTDNSYVIPHPLPIAEASCTALIWIGISGYLCFSILVAVFAMPWAICKKICTNDTNKWGGTLLQPLCRAYGAPESYKKCSLISGQCKSSYVTVSKTLRNVAVSIKFLKI